MLLSAAARVDLGKRAGVIAGLLGVLCVLAEFCFLFPDWLVVPDALPFYRANLTLLRSTLQVLIVLTFVCGVVSGPSASPLEARNLMSFHAGCPCSEM